VGQRKGLGVALGKPVFVTRIDVESGAVHLGDAGSLACARLTVTGTRMREGVTLPRRALVRVRHGHRDAPASLEAGSTQGIVVVTFDEPIPSASPGQVAVFYEEGRVIGGGSILNPETRSSPFPASTTLLPSEA
jgi:tRNA-uridine 2-sulfurtransferase